jgi:zinc protease
MIFSPHQTKSKMKKIIAVIFFSGLVIMASAQQSSNNTMSFTVDGVKVIFKPTVKDVINVRVFFRGGVTNYSQKQAGIEKLALATVVQGGTHKYPGFAFKDTAEYYQIDIGSAAYDDYGDIDVDCISKYFDKAWTLLTEAIMHPNFETKQVELLRAKLIAEAKQASARPDTHVVDLLEQNAFAGTQYETNPDGTPETLSGFTGTDLQSYYESIRNKGQMFIVVAGNISKAELIAKVRASFANVAAKEYKQPVLNEPVWNDHKVLAEQRQLPINYIAAIINAPPMSSPDYPAYRIGSRILGSVLFMNIREQMHLSYDPDAEMVTRQMPYAYMSLSTSDPKRAVTEMVRGLHFAQSITISELSLKHIVNSYILGYFQQQESSAAITGTLGTAEILDAWTTEEELPERLGKVTPQQVADVLNKYIKGLRWSYLGDITLEKQLEADGVFSQ